MSNNNPYGSNPYGSQSPEPNPYGSSPQEPTNNSYPSYPGNSDNVGNSGQGDYPQQPYGADQDSQSPNGYQGFSAYPSGGNDVAAGSQYSSTGKRFLGYLIDFVLIQVILGGILFYFIAGDAISEYLQASVDAVDAGLPAPELPYTSLAFGSLATVITWFVYRIAMETSKGGSLGHMAMGNRIINAHGTNPSVVESLKRNSWYIIMSLLGAITAIGMLLSFAVYVMMGVTIARSPIKQSFADKWAGTVVVDKN